MSYSSPRDEEGGRGKKGEGGGREKKREEEEEGGRGKKGEEGGREKREEGRRREKREEGRRREKGRKGVEKGRKGEGKGGVGGECIEDLAQTYYSKLDLEYYQYSQKPTTHQVITYNLKHACYFLSGYCKTNNVSLSSLSKYLCTHTHVLV